jgi:hypothetical protein
MVRFSKRKMRRPTNRVGAYLEELEPRMLLASSIVAEQATVLSVGLTMGVSAHPGTIEFQTPARATGEYFLNNLSVGGLPPTSDMLLSVSRLPSLSQGLVRSGLVGGSGSDGLKGVGDHGLKPSQEPGADEPTSPGGDTGSDDWVEACAGCFAANWLEAVL